MWWGVTLSLVFPKSKREEIRTQRDTVKVPAFPSLTIFGTGRLPLVRQDGGCQGARDVWRPILEGMRDPGPRQAGRAAAHLHD